MTGSGSMAPLSPHSNGAVEVSRKGPVTALADAREMH